MATLLQRGIHWHREKLPEVAAVTVDLIAGNEAIEGLEAAVPGGRDILQYAIDDNIGTAHTFEWIVAEQNLLFAGVKKSPETGWKIKWQLPDGRFGIFEAMPTSGSRCFDVMDNLGLLYRIHTKLIAIEIA